MKWFFRFFYTALLTFFIVATCNLTIRQKTEPLLFDSIDDVPKRKTALVLGTSKYYSSGTLNEYFKNRMECAADLYHAGKVEQLIVSGDNSSVDYDEPTDMANYLIQLGVPKDKIILDYAGFRTLDSVIRAKKVFNCKSLIIVSQKFHNQRAVYAARAHGIDAIGLNAPDVSSKNNYTHLREIVAKTVMIFEIHLLNSQPKFL